MATDFRSGRDYPRRGRQKLGEFYWLARVYDKARAAMYGTLHDYIYPCPMDRGVFERWRIAVHEFDAAVREHKTDDAILKWVESKVPTHRRDEANTWVIEEKSAALDRQDREEGVFIT